MVQDHRRWCDRFGAADDPSARTARHEGRDRQAELVDQPVRVDLERPPAIHAADHVTGRLRVATASGRSRIRLECDGKPVAAVRADGTEVDAIEEHAGPLSLSFKAGPGAWLASVEDAESGESDGVEVDVGRPGKFRSLVRQMALLQEDEAVDLDSEDAISLRVLPGLDEPFSVLATATSDYGHLCCEQTSAKVLSAVAMYLFSSQPADMNHAEEIILSGIAREKTMWLRGRGLSMYPNCSTPDDYWGPMTVWHLWSLRRLEDVPGMSPALRRAMRDGLAIADDAGDAYGLKRLPKRITNPVEAYAVQVEDSSEGSAYVVYGGDWGLRLRPIESEAPWSLDDPNQSGETHLVLADREDLNQGRG